MLYQLTRIAVLPLFILAGCGGKSNAPAEKRTPTEERTPPKSDGAAPNPEPATRGTLTVKVTGSGRVDPAMGTFDVGKSVRLVAIPDTGWTFSNWSGDLDGKEPTATLTLSGDANVTATFVRAAETGGGATGSVTGRVIFTGDPPGRRLIPTAKDPNCQKSVARIGTENIIVNKKTDPMTLRNVMVYVKDGLGGHKGSPRTEAAVLDQIGCQYQPHVLAMMNTQPLIVKNSDPTNHNIHFLPKVNQEYNFSQPKIGAETELNLKTEDVFKAKCDVHPWMGCWIRVFDHPFFDVTADEGTFTITGLPAGRCVLEAWHEEYGTKTVEVEVAGDKATEADFSYDGTEK